MDSHDHSRGPDSTILKLGKILVLVIASSLITRSLKDHNPNTKLLNYIFEIIVIDKLLP